MARSVPWVASWGGVASVDNFPVERRYTGRAGLIAEQTTDALPHETLLPAPAAGLGLARRRHDGARSHPIGGQKNDAGAPHMLLGRVAVCGNRFKTLTAGRRDSNFDPCAHTAHKHSFLTTRILNRTLMSRSFH